MKYFLYIVALSTCHVSFIKSLVAQTIPLTTEQQLENLTEAQEEDIEDDQYLQQLQYYRQHPLNINTATADDFRVFRFVTDLHIQNLLQYRRLFGNLISIYELQSVPTWDLTTIRKIQLFITTEDPINVREEMLNRLRKGEHYILGRTSRVLEKQRGYDTSLSTHYLGNPYRLLFRYKYQYKNLLQYGLTADKDAGEAFFKGAQSKGFDHYSFHFFARQLGIIKSLALGDFAINLGQGLTQWSSLAFKKGSEVMSIKRQAPILNPFGSGAEFNFNRGAGLTIKKGSIEATAFGSFQKISGNAIVDTLTNEEAFSSLLTSGLHRTPSEIADRNNIDQTSFGGNITYQGNLFKLGLNAITYQFSNPLQKNDEPYNRFAISGKGWANYSVDYSFTKRNVHFFGEAAADKNFNKAFVNGVLVSVDPKVDVSLLYRNIHQAYQSLYGNAFTESFRPSNEKGFYTGITIRPASIWRIDAYADFYKSSYLKFRVDAPSQGRDYLLQLTYQPNKRLEIYTRFRNEHKQINESETDSVTNFLVIKPRQNWRVHFNYIINPALTIKARTEAVWFNKNEKDSEKGFLTYLEGAIKPGRSLSANLRLQYFETNGFDSRIYAYESDVLYSYSIPVFLDKGFRYYLNLNYDFSKKLTVWLRFAQTIYRDQEMIGSGLDEIKGNKRSEIKLQLRYIL